MRSNYLVAADGAHRPVREHLGIDMLGRGSFADCVTIYFKANVRTMIGDRNLSVGSRAQGGCRPDVPGRGRQRTTVEATACAARFHDWRVFLAGDSAHVMPPTGGFGGNTGIADAHNLAWKLAMVVNGVAAPELLGSYDPERRPVCDLTAEQAHLPGLPERSRTITFSTARS